MTGLVAMGIALRIENCDQLPDGGPVEYRAEGRSFEIGREPHLDWTLPDPGRFISGKHCEIRYENGIYNLYDVSRNGTFLNGAQSRMRSPHRLATGDRLQIGQYLVGVTVSETSDHDAGFDASRQGFSPAAPASDSIWDLGGAAPAPIDRRELMASVKRGRRAPDFSEQYLELPRMDPGPSPVAPAANPYPFGPPPSAQHRPAPFAPAASESPFGPAPVAQPAAPPPFGAQPVAPPATASESPFGGAPSAPPPFVAPPPVFQPPSADRNPFGVVPVQADEGFLPPPRQQPVPVAPAPAVAPPMARPAGADADFMAAFAAGAGISPAVLGRRDPREVAHELGVVVQLMVTQLSRLLKARAAAKAMAKSSRRTMLGATENNPLKFIPDPAEIIEVMFAGRRGYMDARASVESGFADLEAHEIATFAAMQKALLKLTDTLSPQAIEAKLPSSTFSSKKARAWDSYVERWEQMAEQHEHGVLNVFLSHFADAYDEASKGKK